MTSTDKVILFIAIPLLALFITGVISVSDTEPAENVIDYSDTLEHEIALTYSLSTDSGEKIITLHPIYHSLPIIERIDVISDVIYFLECEQQNIREEIDSLVIVSLNDKGLEI